MTAKLKKKKNKKTSNKGLLEKAETNSSSLKVSYKSPVLGFCKVFSTLISMQMD
jgi:hypothetical protein